MNTHPAIYDSRISWSNIPIALTFFTDGSKVNDKTASVAVLNKRIVNRALPEKNSIFSAEVYAIDLALNLISENKSKNVTISDSVLLSIRKKKS